MTDFVTTNWISQDTFDGLPPDAVSLLETCFQERHFRQGEHLIHQGDIGEEMFVISSGDALVMTEDEQGQRHVIARTGPGDVLGEMALLACEPRTADAIAQEPLVARVLPASTFHTLIESYPEFSQFLTRLIATRVGGPDRDVLVGRDMDGFRITRRLGRGGMAVVYKATGPGGQKVALKMMSHRLVCDERSERRSNGKPTSSRPSITRTSSTCSAVSRCSTHSSSSSSTSTESRWTSWSTTAARCLPLPCGKSSANFPGTQIRSRFRDHSPRHQAGQRDDHPRRPDQLMDFGLAKPTNANSSDDRILVGTPGYMAPELLNGGEPGPASDLFAMGCLAIELLDGTKLFAQTTVKDFVTVVRQWKGWDPSSLGLQIDTNWPR
ncbi:MAG: hypothetical protein CM1200mP2_12660 [Planctomycetaceae bacterium]|nr:MAG: hypothetical protein CM1200mP2_12660 [Planctomycetaceae bacterium]